MFYTQLCSYVFLPVSEIQRCARKRLYCKTGRIQVLFLSPLFLPFLLYFPPLLSFSYFPSVFPIQIYFFLCLASSSLSSLSFPSFKFPVFYVVKRTLYIPYSNYRWTETPSLFFSNLLNP